MVCHVMVNPWGIIPWRYMGIDVYSQVSLPFFALALKIGTFLNVLLNLIQNRYICGTGRSRALLSALANINLTHNLDLSQLLALVLGVLDPEDRRAHGLTWSKFLHLSLSHR